MGAAHFFKVLLMCVSLAGVIVVMGRLNQSPGSMNVAKRARTAKLVEGVNVCPTRVTRLENSAWSVFEEGLNWYRQTGSQRQKLDPIAVEKWFSQNCTLLGQPVAKVSPDLPNKVEAALKISFVSGQPQTLSKTAEGYYGWMDRWYKSNQAAQAIQDLGALPASVAR